MGFNEPTRRSVWLFFAFLILSAGAYVTYSRVNVLAGERDGEGAASHAAKGEEERAVSPLVLWQDMLEGNRRFMRGSLEPKSILGRRQMLVKGQHPKIAVLGCADSRVAPELLFDKSLGDLFVVRTAGNITDPIALGSLEYAVEHLHVRTLLVLGHEKCGAVAAAAAGQAMPTLNLDAIVNKITPALRKVENCNDPVELAMRQVIANVHQSAMSIVEDSPILKKATEAHELTITKAVYYLESGEVKRLQ
ncbi:MAG: carbonic anhydrase [Planctomycetes bacterium]|nr:carbonic anhydrase [Planctomycetota bacterium]